ncbi:MAG TPA: hypothetical protein VFJ58_14205 [Armatimonadota bacterium]|nr:hypothetical protein [Armatimonadota bacterium]
MDETWSVVKTDLTTAEVTVAGPIVARRLQMPLAEAAGRVRSARGILMRMLERPAAEQMAAELSAAGIPATAAPDVMTAPPVRPYVLRNASATGTSFMPHKDLGRAVDPLPWTEVKVVVAGQAPEVETRRVKVGGDRRWALVSTAVGLVAGVPVPPRFGGSATTRLEEHVEIRNWLDILGGDPIQHYRIDGGRFNYASILPQPAPVAEANFCYLVTGLITAAPGCATNVLPCHIGQDGSLSLEVFSDIYDYEKAVTWLLALQRLGLWNASVTSANRPPDVDVNQTLKMDYDSSTNSTLGGEERNPFS